MKQYPGRETQARIRAKFAKLMTMIEGDKADAELFLRREEQRKRMRRELWSATSRARATHRIKQRHRIQTYATLIRN